MNTFLKKIKVKKKKNVTKTYKYNIKMIKC